MRNRKRLTQRLYCIYNKGDMSIGRPTKPAHLRRSKLFPLRLTPSELASFEEASRKLEEPVAAILRKGALLYIGQRGKGGSRLKGERR